ncbi:MAG TPA: monothiol bacilliredoxin BrxC family protein [Vicinamibacteria bacterium]|nr:monothiol bacilliredoxin BrxC family protein [Vicinamibacteria bacterium]
MSFESRIRFLASPGEVDAFLVENPTSAIFKAGTCHKTSEVFRNVEHHFAGREEIRVGVIRVLEARAASNHVAERTGIVHESPQLILFREGRPVFDRDNWDITDEAVAEGLQALDAARPSTSA